MKITLLTIFVITIVGNFVLAQDAPAPKGINEQIANALENIKKQMPCGFPEQGIPPLAPLKKEYLEIKKEHALFSFVGNFFDLRIDGLNNFKNFGTTFSVFTLKGTFDLNFNNILANGDYVMNFFPINLFRITGSGLLDFELKDLRVKGDFKLGSKGRGIQIKTLNVDVVLGDVKSNLSGLLGGGLPGRLANRSIESFVKFFMRRQSKFISDKIRETVLPQVNGVLSKYTIADILKIITSSQKPPNCVPPEEDQVNELMALLEILDE